MNLIIDVGNTNIKLAVYSKSKLIKKVVVKKDDFFDEAKKIIAQYKSIDKGIISSVGKIKASEVNFISKKLALIKLDSNTETPFKNLYKTPKTLGVDRIALIAASVNRYPTKNVLIIDAGTCITYDFINHKNEYLGGAISPGIRIRYEALHNLTANLPLLEKKRPKNILGNTTESSINSGVVNGVIMEIDGIVKEYSIKYSDLTVILTGGDAKFLSKQLKSGIFANSNFLLEGLNHILEYNSN